jgi:hypothetical protein
MNDQTKWSKDDITKMILQRLKGHYIDLFL